jgi:hypothetical protein
MKKQILIFAATFITVAFISCSKERIETPITNPETEEVTGLNKPGGPIVIDPLSYGLWGRYEFNNTLKDTTNQLPSWFSTNNRVLYTTDRKGQTNRAVKFNGAYGLIVKTVPVDTTMSVSVWVKNEIFPVNYRVPFLEIARGLCYYQQENKYMATYWNNVAAQFVWSGAIDNNWHHLASTRDKVSLKFYIDGVLVATAPSPAGSGPSDLITDYNIGYGFNNGYKYWKGSMDDLRIYKRVLTSTEVNKLKNL